MDEQQLSDVNDLLIRLEGNADFRTWRDLLVKPLLDQIDEEKIKVISMTEADVKALILNERFVKGVFKKAFEQARVQRELEKGGELDGRTEG